MGYDIKNRLIVGFKVPFEQKVGTFEVTKYKEDTGEPYKKQVKQTSFVSEIEIENLPEEFTYLDSYLGRVADQSTVKGLKLFSDTYDLYAGIEISAIGQNSFTPMATATEFNHEEIPNAMFKIKELGFEPSLIYVPINSY